MLSLWLCTSCDWAVSVIFTNNSDKNIIAFVKEKYLADNDTVFPSTIDASLEEYLCNRFLISQQHDREILSAIGDKYVTLRSVWPVEIDTLHLFILDADSLQKYGWEEGAKRGNILLQRYDLNIDDLDDGIGLPLSYPTTPEMGRYIKMWPPYN